MLQGQVVHSISPEETGMTSSGSIISSLCGIYSVCSSICDSFEIVDLYKALMVAFSVMSIETITKGGIYCPLEDKVAK